MDNDLIAAILATGVVAARSANQNDVEIAETAVKIFEAIRDRLQKAEPITENPMHII